MDQQFHNHTFEDVPPHTFTPALFPVSLMRWCCGRPMLKFWISCGERCTNCHLEQVRYNFWPVYRCPQCLGQTTILTQYHR